MDVEKQQRFEMRDMQDKIQSLAAENGRLKMKCRWINAKDMLPLPHLYVLCCCEYNHSVRIPYVSYHDGDEWACGYKVTHWLYLPELPEYEEDAENAGL